MRALRGSDLLYLWLILLFDEVFWSLNQDQSVSQGDLIAGLIGLWLFAHCPYVSASVSNDGTHGESVGGAGGGISNGSVGGGVGGAIGGGVGGSIGGGVDGGAGGGSFGGPGTFFFSAAFFAAACFSAR